MAQYIFACGNVLCRDSHASRYLQTAWNGTVANAMNEAVEAQLQQDPRVSSVWLEEWRAAPPPVKLRMEALLQVQAQAQAQEDMDSDNTAPQPEADEVDVVQQDAEAPLLLLTDQSPQADTADSGVALQQQEDDAATGSIREQPQQELTEDAALNVSQEELNAALEEGSELEPHEEPPEQGNDSRRALPSTFAADLNAAATMIFPSEVNKHADDQIPPRAFADSNMAAVLQNDLGPKAMYHHRELWNVVRQMDYDLSIEHLCWTNFVFLHSANLEAVANGTLKMAPGVAVFKLSRAQLIARMQAPIILAYIAVHMTTPTQFDALRDATNDLKDIIKLFQELRRIAKQLDQNVSLPENKVSEILATIARAGGIHAADTVIVDAAPVPNNLLQVASLCALHASMFAMAFDGDTQWRNIAGFDQKLHDVCIGRIGPRNASRLHAAGDLYISALDGNTFAKDIVLCPWMKASKDDFAWLKRHLAADASMQLPLSSTTTKPIFEFAALLFGTLVLHELTTAAEGSDVQKSMDAYLENKVTFLELRDKVFFGRAIPVAL
jgi:hypothetical protein